MTVHVEIVNEANDEVVNAPESAASATFIDCGRGDVDTVARAFGVTIGRRCSSPETREHWSVPFRSLCSYSHRTARLGRRCGGR